MKMISLMMILLLISTLTAEASNQEKGNNGIGNICEKNNPCENGGICGYTRGGYICKCQKGWEGDNCSRNICEKNNPCENGGICGYTRGGYICKCQKGWEGDNCSRKICEKNNPCENGGICGYTHEGYICKCQKGWEGDNCSEKSSIIDPCEIPQYDVYQYYEFSYSAGYEDCKFCFINYDPKNC